MIRTPTVQRNCYLPMASMKTAYRGSCLEEGGGGREGGREGGYLLAMQPVKHSYLKEMVMFPWFHEDILQKQLLGGREVASLPYGQ